MVPVAGGAAFSILLDSFTPLRTRHWHWSLTFLAVYCLTANILYVRTARRDTFTSQLMAAIVIKLLAGLTVIVLYRVFFHKDFPAFSIHFILHYILFTVFEIRYLLFIVKKQTSQPK
jgi:hypothetical protein